MVARPGNSFAKNIFRTIRGTMSRFLAIFAIVGLGVGFLAGLLASPDDMRASADRYCDAGTLYDLKVMSTQGLTEGDMEALRALPGVEAVMPAYDTDLVLLTGEGDDVTASIHSMPEDPPMNLVTLIEGRMPQAPGECVAVMSKSFSGEKSWVGEVLRQEPDRDGNLNAALPERFTIVGFVTSPAYFSIEQEYTTVGNGKISMILYTGDDTFDQDYFTAAYLLGDGLKDLNAFGRAYEEQVDALSEGLTELGEDRAQVRFEEIVGDAQAELDDARADYEEEKEKALKELDDALRTLTDGEAEIAENEATLEDARVELENGWAALADGQTALERQISDGWAEIESGQAQIEQYEALLADGQAQLDAARAQVTKAEEDLTAGEAALTQGEAALTETKAQLDALTAGKDQLFAAAESMGIPVSDRSDGAALALMAQLEAVSPALAERFSALKEGLSALAASGTDSEKALAEWAAGSEALTAQRAQWEAGKATLEENKAQLSEKQKALDAQAAELAAQKTTLENGRQALITAQAQGEAQLADSRAELVNAQAEYDDGVKALADAREELQKGKEEYADAKREADEKLSDGERELLDAQEEIDAIEPGEWLIFTREDNVSFSSYKSNAEKIAAIATVFPVFFFLVAALVALTTMTRMVEEERGQIGAMKALGYSSGRIAEKYLIYAATAAVLGSAVGLAIGLRLFPTIIINAYNIMFSIPQVVTRFEPGYAFFASGTAVVCTLLATVSALGAELKESPASLLLPRAPKAGKRIFLERITPLWKRFSFTRKVTARNLFRYKKRFFMTVIGIAGCTALLLTGFGLRDSISDIVDLQFNDLDRYQLLVGLEDGDAPETPQVREILEDRDFISDYAVVMQNNGHADMPGCPGDEVVILAPEEPERFSEFYDFRSRTDGAPVPFGEDAVVITEKLSERQGVGVGDALTVKNQAGVSATLTVTGVCENYVYHYLYLSPETYEAAFGEPMEANALFCVLPEGLDAEARETLSTRLLDCEGVAGAQYTGDISESFRQSLKSIDTIVVVLIVSAGALAFVVLYNLTNINISEREKELATIKVLGFYDGEVAAYIYRETAVLTVIGAGLGLILGIFLHQFVIRTAEIDIVMFGRCVYPLSYVWAFLLTLVFSFLVNLVMARKLMRISMVESLKAPE